MAWEILREISKTAILWRGKDAEGRNIYCVTEGEEPSGIGAQYTMTAALKNYKEEKDEI